MEIYDWQLTNYGRVAEAPLELARELVISGPASLWLGKEPKRRKGDGSGLGWASVCKSLISHFLPMQVLDFPLFPSCLGVGRRNFQIQASKLKTEGNSMNRGKSRNSFSGWLRSGGRMAAAGRNSQIALIRDKSCYFGKCGGGLGKNSLRRKVEEIRRGCDCGRFEVQLTTRRARALRSAKGGGGQIVQLL